jgi:hypothetical protein
MGCWHGPQTPTVEPEVTSQVAPAQQSALMLQPPHFGTHEPPA